MKSLTSAAVRTGILVVLMAVFAIAGVAAAPAGAAVISSGARFLVYEAQSNSQYTQLDVVNQVARLLASPHLAVSPAVRTDLFDALSMVATSGTAVRATMAGNTVINSFPLIRAQACREIGTLGGKRAEAVLLRVLRIDTNPLVLAEATYQLGKLGRDPGNRVSNAIAAALSHSSPLKGDGIFVYQALATLATLARTTNAPPDPAIWGAIADIGKMGYNGRVDSAATAALRSLVSYG